MLDDQVTAKICIPKIIFNICDVRKKRSDEVFLYITVCVFMGIFFIFVIQCIVSIKCLLYNVYCSLSVVNTEQYILTVSSVRKDFI